MLLIIILALVTLFLFIAAAVFFAPLSIKCFGSIQETVVKAGGLVSWFHPMVLRGVFDTEKNKFAVFVFGKQLFLKRKAAEKPPQAAVDQSASAIKTGSFKIFGKRPEQHPDSTPSAHTARVDKDSAQPFSSPVEQGPASAKSSPVKASGGKGKTAFSAKMKPLKKILVFLGNASFRGKTLRWLKRVVFAFFHIALVDFVKAGFDDPSRTGAAYGYFIGLKHMLATAPGSKLDMVYEPVFDGAPLKAEGEIRVSSSIARLCFPIVLALITFPYVHAFILFRRARKI
jgi:hypothetical protein